jgi:hypothetical protein
MKTCIKCRVTKATEDFNARQSQCKACKAKYNKGCVRTSNGRLRFSYEACKRRHVFKLKRESKMMPFARFKAIYNAQGGRCVESGAPFVFDSKDLFPSADRIDNNGGYENGNIRFVTWRVNNLRGAKTIEEFRGSSQDRPSVVLPDYIFTIN